MKISIVNQNRLILLTNTYAHLNLQLKYIIQTKEECLLQWYYYMINVCERILNWLHNNFNLLFHLNHSESNVLTPINIGKIYMVNSLKNINLTKLKTYNKWQQIKKKPPAQTKCMNDLTRIFKTTSKYNP